MASTHHHTMAFALVLGTVAATALAAEGGRVRNEVLLLPGHTKVNDTHSPLPHTYVPAASIPTKFSWGLVNGTSYLTKSLNQHIPQYCGSCWAHGAASAFADRIKIARKAQGPDVNLAIQFILNCGAGIAGSCHGGSASGLYDFVKNTAGHWPFDTCMQYAACSADSTEGACSQGNWSCNAFNTCRTCSTFADDGGFCSAISSYPNATVAEYGVISGATAMQAEIYTRGPIACVVNAEPLHTYTGGIFNNESAPRIHNHIVSIVGWSQDLQKQPYWIVRNSWGEFWGEMGYFRIKMGTNQLDIEQNCAWAVPGMYTETNQPCFEDGSNCKVVRN